MKPGKWEEPGAAAAEGGGGAAGGVAVEEILEEDAVAEVVAAWHGGRGFTAIHTEIVASVFAAAQQPAVIKDSVWCLRHHQGAAKKRNAAVLFIKLHTQATRWNH